MSKPLLDAINAGTAHVVTMTRDEAEEVWHTIEESNEKSEELGDALDNARTESGAKSYVIIEITG